MAFATGVTMKINELLFWKAVAKMLRFAEFEDRAIALIGELQAEPPVWYGPACPISGHGAKFEDINSLFLWDETEKATQGQISAYHLAKGQRILECASKHLADFIPRAQKDLP